MQFVQFTDSTETKIITVFGCEQDATVWPNQGQVEDTDARYLAFLALIDSVTTPVPAPSPTPAPTVETTSTPAPTETAPT